jgi:hypothetical protein
MIMWKINISLDQPKAPIFITPKKERKRKRQEEHLNLDSNNALKLREDEDVPPKKNAWIDRDISTSSVHQSRFKSQTRGRAPLSTKYLS